MKQFISRALRWGRDGQHSRWRGALPWLIVLFAVAYRDAPFRRPKGPPGGTLSNIQFETLDGVSISTSQLKGKAVIVNFWTPSCPPCRLEVPWLERLQEGGKGKVVVIGVLAGYGMDFEGSEFMRSEAASYPIVRESPQIDAAFGGISILPTTFYVDKTGRVVHSTAGLIPQSMMRRYLEDALK